MPPIGTLKAYLVMKRDGARFRESAADDLIEEFSSTISFAKLLNNDNIPEHGDAKHQQFEENKMLRERHDKSSKSYQLSEIPLLFPDGKKGSINIPHPLSENEWNLIESILMAYKPSLVKEKQSEVKQEGYDTETSTGH